MPLILLSSNLFIPQFCGKWTLVTENGGGGNFMYTENAGLTSNSNKVKRKTDMSQGCSAPLKAEEKLWFCAKFQRNKCQDKESHTIQVRGRIRFAKRFCASCWQKDRR